MAILSVNLYSRLFLAIVYYRPTGLLRQRFFGEPPRYEDEHVPAITDL